MKLFITIFFLNLYCCCYSQCDPTPNKICYDARNNIIASSGYVDIDKLKEVTFKDTITDIRYRLDSSHHYIICLNEKGETIWKTEPNYYLIDSIYKPYVVKMKIDKYSNTNDLKKKDKIFIFIKSSNREYGYIDLKTGQYKYRRND